MSRFCMRLSAQWLAGLAVAATAFSAHAGEPEVRESIARVMPGARIVSVLPSPVPGVFEVFVNGDIVYMHESGRYVLAGNLIEVPGMTNLTEARMEKLLAVPFSELPLELAVKTVKGDGRRVLATFEDPNCGYCKQLHAALGSLDNYTLYTFMVPFLGPDSEAKLRTIWCAADPAAALDEALRGKARTEPGRCDVPVSRLKELASRLNVSGTPTLFFHDGSRVGGFIPADQIERRLVAATSRSQGAAVAR